MSFSDHMKTPNEFYGYDIQPSQKQIDYAEKLAEIYEVDLSQVPFTRNDYAEFIETFKDM